MPTTRRSTGSAKSGPAKGQTTLTFSNQITKNVPSHTKKEIVSTPAVAKVEPVKKEEEEVTDEEPELEDIPVEPKVEFKEEEDVKEEEEEEEEDSFVEEEPRVKSAEELQAEKITTTQINKYWKQLESERKAPRVHQKDLIVSEKVLRYFDVSSQYGPCVGIARMKRWERAHRLGLNPPIEVLAVLVKEEEKGAPDVETAQFDRILNSTSSKPGKKISGLT